MTDCSSLHDQLKWILIIIISVPHELCAYCNCRRYGRRIIKSEVVGSAHFAYPCDVFIEFVSQFFAPLYCVESEADESTGCSNTVDVGSYQCFGSVLHSPVLQFFFNEKRYYVNL